ncbi:hypothetical protein [Ralstonia chuxiongensis]|uniref:Phage protein n=1 Tax=Ralstonia chuxiongensis TaxID=2957504 RepID=A0AA41WUG1_9RALS|nr:hypothetical protein [Ralstonia chuxiongensis]MCP1173049.1 hypothetical protein [Ralstonia chuxiongensis]
MSKYAIRCTIHDGSWQDYENLHSALATIGCFRNILADNGTRYSLPDATYVCTTLMSVEQLRDAVVQLAQRVSPPGTGPEVIVFEWGNSAWYLKPAPAQATVPLATLAALGLPVYR